MNDVTVNNGWEEFTNKNNVSNGAVEYIVKSTPGESFEMTVTVSASGPADVQVSVRMQAYKVNTSLTNCKWYVSSGTTLTPHVLVGERISGSLSVDTLSFYPNTTAEKFYQWTVPGTIFKNWDPFAVVNGVSIPAYDDEFNTNNDLKQASPYWYWKATATASRTVIAQGKVNLSANKYNPKEATVSDDFQVEVVRPTISVSQLAFATTQPLVYGKTSSPTFAHIGIDIDAPSGYVSVPSAYTDNNGNGGTYAFAQVITSTNRTFTGPNSPLTFSNKLDGTFPYAFNQQFYGVGETSRFHDTPNVSSDPTPPLSASDAFKVTIMYKPSTSGACWVPLRNATWSWNASVTSMANVTPTPSLIGSRTSSNWTDIMDHPTWNGAQSLN